MLKHVVVPIHRDGWKFVAIFAGVTIGLALLWAPLGWLGLLATAWCVYFFRDPPRVTPTRPDLVVSPADGLIVSIVDVPPPPELDMGAVPVTRIGIFLNVFDVHINRTPIAGTIVKTHYHKGQFLNASFDKASELNERMAIRMVTPAGLTLAFVQVAGLVARRIVCHLVPDQVVAAGEKFGLIRFGSRTDVYLPAGWNALVVTGQRVVGGETVLADGRSTEPARQGLVH